MELAPAPLRPMPMSPPETAPEAATTVALMVCEAVAVALSAPVRFMLELWT